MKTKEIVRYSIFLVIAIIANYIDYLIILPLPFPCKLGLANSISLLILYIYGRDKYLIFVLLRVLLSAILFTGFGTTFMISLGGNILASLITISLSFNRKISIYGLSINGGIFHGIGQIIVVSIFYQTMLMINIAILLTITGIITGALMAIVTKLVIKKLPNNLLKIK